MASQDVVDDDNGNCCICLETLLSGDVALGATVPCGHVFHQPCLDQLEAFGVGRGCANKCPMCNTKRVKFIKLWLDLPTAKPPSDVPVDLDGDDDAVSDETYRALRQQAAQYRSKWQMAKENLAKQAQRLQRYQQEVDTLQEQLLESAGTVEEQIEKFEQQRRLVEALRLEKVQLESKCNIMESRLQLADQKAQDARQILLEARQQYEVEIQKAQHDSLHELKVLSTRQPQLERKIRRLEQENKELRKLVRQVTSHTGASTSTTVSNSGSQQRAMLKHLGATSPLVGTKRPLTEVNHPPRQSTFKQAQLTTNTTPASDKRYDRSSSILSVLDQADIPIKPLPKPKLNIPTNLETVFKF